MNRPAIGSRVRALNRVGTVQRYISAVEGCPLPIEDLAEVLLDGDARPCMTHYCWLVPLDASLSR
jgi:hypothetical protein